MNINNYESEYDLNMNFSTNLKTNMYYELELKFKFHVTMHKGSRFV